MPLLFVFFCFISGPKPDKNAFCKCASGLQKAGLADKLPDCKVPNMRVVPPKARNADFKKLFEMHCDTCRFSDLMILKTDAQQVKQCGAFKKQVENHFLKDGSEISLN